MPNLIETRVNKYCYIERGGRSPILMPVIVQKKDKYVAVYLKNGRSQYKGFTTRNAAEHAVQVFATQPGKRVEIHKLYARKPAKYKKTIIEHNKTKRTGGVCEKCELYARAVDTLQTPQLFPTQVKQIPVVADCKACLNNLASVKNIYQSRYAQLQHDCAEHPAPNCLMNGNIKADLDRTTKKYARYNRALQLVNLQYQRSKTI